MSAAYLLIDGPAGGPWNMAVDEALLEEAANTGRAFVRFYGWAAPTLSLGYFQAAGDRRSHAASARCPLVRRSSGGGAIVHHRELTYSLALPLASRFDLASQAVYMAAHETLAEALASRAVRVELRETSPPASVPAEGPFLCFQQQAAGDVLLEGQKVAGSAQRRRRGAILQHGSVLLAASPAAPELPGIAELAGMEIDERALAEQWAPRLASRLGLSLAPGRPETVHPSRVANLVRDKFGSQAWTLRR